MSRSIGSVCRRSESVEPYSRTRLTGMRSNVRPRRCVRKTTSASKAKPSSVRRENISCAARWLNAFSPHCVSVTSRETSRLTTSRKSHVASVRENFRCAGASIAARSRAPKTTSHCRERTRSYARCSDSSSKGRSASVKAITRPVARSIGVANRRALAAIPRQRDGRKTRAHRGGQSAVCGPCCRRRPRARGSRCPTRRETAAPRPASTAAGLLRCRPGMMSEKS